MQDLLNYFTEDYIDTYLPERNLLAAILDRAIMDTWESKDQELKRDIRRWMDKKIAAKKATPFSFQWVCEHLDFDPIVMKGIIKNLDRDLYRKHR